MVSAEQSMQITKCGSPIWGKEGEHSRVSWNSRKGLGVLPLLRLLVPQVPSTMLQKRWDLMASHFESKCLLLPQSSVHITQQL